MASAAVLAAERAATRLESESVPPTFSFSVTNSSAVMAEASKAFRPYCTPTLSSVVSARKLAPPGMPVVVPHTAAARSGSPQRVPVGLLIGS